jgi:DNA-binding NarL/FixJ family response regulator
LHERAVSIAVHGRLEDQISTSITEAPFVDGASEFIARIADVRFVTGRALRAESTLVAGPSGIGKTFVLDQVALSVIESSITVVRVRATVQLSGHPFGSLASGLGMRGWESLAPADLLAGVDREFSRIARGTAVVVLFIDDAHHLDVESAGWVARVVDERGAAVVATINFAATVPDSSPQSAASTFAELWAGSRAERLDLTQLNAEQSQLLLDRFAGSETVDRVSQASILHMATGIPLLIREFARAITDALRPGFATDERPLTSRLLDLGGMRVRGLSSEEMAAIVVLDRLGGVPRGRARHLFGADVMSTLERRAHVHLVEESPRLLIGQPLDARAISSVGATAALVGLTERVAAIIIDDYRSGGVVSPIEAAFVADQWTANGSAQPTAARTTYGDDTVVRVLELAAFHANDRAQPSMALFLARTVEQIRPSVAAMRAATIALAGMGQLAAALSVLERALTSASDDEMIDLDRLTWLLDELEPSKTGDADVAIDTLQAVGDNTAIDWRLRLHACENMAWLALARGDGARLRHARQTVAAVVDARPFSPSRADEKAAFTALAVGHVFAHLDLADIRSEIDRRIAVALRLHEAADLAVLGALSGVAAIEATDYPRAEIELRLAITRYSGPQPAQWTVWVECQYARALALAGRTDEAETQLISVSRRPYFDTLWCRGWHDSALVDLRDSQGRIDDARALSLRLATMYADSPIRRAQHLFRAVICGAPVDRVLDQMADAEARSDLISVRALALYVRSVADGDGEGMAAAGDDLAAVGMVSAADAAYSAAAASFSAAGSRRRAAAARAALGALRSGRQPRAERRQPDLVALTPREREIARMVADGRSNKDIAETLFLSVRTVESHVYRVLDKVGAASRRDVTELFHRQTI